MAPSGLTVKEVLVHENNILPRSSTYYPTIPQPHLSPDTSAVVGTRLTHLVWMTTIEMSFGSLFILTCVGSIHGG